jgi:hypothetical protein
MKPIFALCGLILLAGGFWIYRSTRTPMTYGKFTGAPAAQVAQLIEQPKANLGKTWTIEGIIQDQCTTMGCYFFFKEGGKSLRVDLQEIAMYAPKQKNGKPARVEGRIVPYGDGYQFWASAVDFK